MNQTQNIQPRYLAYPSHPADLQTSSSQALGAGANGAKFLGGVLGSSNTSGTPAAWMEQNRYIYDAIQNGSSDLSPQDTDTFMQWWNWSSQKTLGDASGGNWDPSTSAAATPAQDVPEGAILGVHGNVVWDSQDVAITHSDDTRPRDIFAENFSLDVPNFSAQVIAERTSDTRTNPAEEVTKITVRNQATGVDTVYFLHGDANAVIRTSKPDQLTDTSGLVQWEQYSAPVTATADSNAKPAFSGGEVEQTDATHFVHTALSGEQINFTPQPTDPGPEHHEVFGDCNITLRSDYSANLTYDDDAKNPAHIITVKDRDGKTIAVYSIPYGKGFKVNVNSKDVTSEGKDVSDISRDDKDDSDFWKDDFSINGKSALDLTKKTTTKTSSTKESGTTEKKDSPKVKAAEQTLDNIHDKTGQPLSDIRKILMGDDLYYSELYKYAGEDGVLSDSEFKKAIDAGALVFPPKTPDSKFFRLLSQADQTLGDALGRFQAITPLIRAGRDVSESYYTDIRGRVVDLINGIYGPNLIAKAKEDDSDNIYLNGKEYDLIDQNYIGSDLSGFLKLDSQS